MYSILSAMFVLCFLFIAVSQWTRILFWTLRLLKALIYNYCSYDYFVAFANIILSAFVPLNSIYFLVSVYSVFAAFLLFAIPHLTIYENLLIATIIFYIQMIWPVLSVTSVAILASKVFCILCVLYASIIITDYILEFTRRIIIELLIIIFEGLFRITWFFVNPIDFMFWNNKKCHLYDKLFVKNMLEL